jgi:hypothetical protein
MALCIFAIIYGGQATISGGYTSLYVLHVVAREGRKKL